jgi:hypothetical protein
MAPPPPPGSAEKHKGKARSSEYVGVYWDKRSCKWAARISHEGKEKGKGTFHTEEEVARAFDDAAWELRGGVAHGAKFSLNFPTEVEKQEAEKQEAAAVAAIEPAKPAPLLGSLDVQQLLATYGPMGGEPCGAGSDGDAPDDDGVREPAGPTGEYDSAMRAASRSSSGSRSRGALIRLAGGHSVPAWWLLAVAAGGGSQRVD